MTTGGRVPAECLRSVKVLGTVSCSDGASRTAQLAFLRGLYERTWTDYLIAPEHSDAEFWASVTKRFGVTDLVTPAVNCILGATMGRQPRRRVSDAMVEDELSAVVGGPGWADVWYGFCRDVVLYGTAFIEVGWDRRARLRLTLLPATEAQVITADDDVDDVRGVRVLYGAGTSEPWEKEWRDDGSVWKRRGGSAWLQVGAAVGFLPVVIGRSPHRSSGSPYGLSLVRAAGEESRQATSLSNDVVVLARMQSFSTMVIQGSNVSVKDRETSGPHGFLRFTGDDANAKAYYITPDAKIAEIDGIIDRKYERAAAQCSVPVDIFRQAKSGTNQGSGAAMLTHKPLFDLACSLQDIQRRAELEGMAMVDAMLLWSQWNSPVDLDEVRAGLDAEVEFEHTMNPTVVQADVQAWKLAVDERFVDFERARSHFNATDDEAAVVAALAEREESARTRAAASVPFL